MTKRRMSLVSALMLMSFLLATSSAAQDVPELKNIDLQKGQSQLDVKLEITAPFNYESFTLFNPNRLVIDLIQVRQFSVTPDISVNEYGVLKIRTARNQPDVVRVVFDLEETVPAYSVEESSDGITISFRPENMPVRTPEEKPVVKEEVVEKPEIKEATPVTPAPREEARTTPSGEKGTRFGISVQGGPYLATSADFKEIYGSSAIFFGGGLSFLFPLGDQEDIGISLDGSVVQKTGQTSFTQEEVKIRFLPFSLSVFYQRDFGTIIPFAGLGADYFSYKETLPVEWEVPDVTGSLIGYSFLIGTHFEVTPQFMAKVYIRYHVATKTEEEIEINLSGTELGLGLTYYFEF